jgi:hypothetical protein
MHLRIWAIGAATVLTVLAVPATAQASVGVGIQAGPVRLTGAAHPGGKYALPAVLVENTGTQPESVTIRIERVSAGSGRTVPPSWVHAADSTVTLGGNQSARVPLELVVPASARPGTYVSDVVAAGGPASPTAGTSFDAGAATNLEFKVVPGAAAGPWFSVPSYVLLEVAAAFLIVGAAMLIRRSGLRIRIDREHAGYPSVAWRRRRPGRPLRWPLLAVLAAAATALTGCGTHSAPPKGASDGAAITLTLHTVHDARNASVSPQSGTFTHCTGGSAADNTASTADALGYPNGQCKFFWITITNKGVPAKIDVVGSDASPSDQNGQWVLCGAGKSPAVACTGHGHLPGQNQYRLVNYNTAGGTNSAGISDGFACDREFGVAGSCSAMPGQLQTEGVVLTGPAATTDASLKWSVTITWYAVPG